MKFLTSAEKVQKLRNQLNITQEDLQTEKVTRGLISMIETGRREVTYNTAVRLAEQFSKKAQELNIILNIDEGYLMRSPSEDAEIYCLNKLKNDDITDNTIKEIFELIDQYNLLLVQAKTYFKIGQLSSNKRDFGEAIINYNKAINIYKSMGKSEELGYVYLKMGICKTESLKYDTAIVYYGLSQYYSFVYEDKKIQRFCLYNLANNYLQTNEIELALNTIEKCLVLFDKERVSELYMFAQGVKATCYEAKGEYSIAIEIYKTALSKLTDDESTFLGYAYNNLGLDYSSINDFKESIKYFEMAEKFRREVDKKTLSHSLIEKSNVFSKQNLNVDAIKTIELGLKYAKEYKDIEYLLKGNYLLVDIYDKTNDIKNLERVYLELMDLLRDNGDNRKLKSIYDKIALMYSRQGKSTLSEEYLLLSTGLN